MSHRELTEESAIALSRARLAAIVRSSADAIIGETLDGIITDWNPAAERLYGYSAEEAIGQHLSFLAPPDLAHEPADLLARVCAGERVESIETTRLTKDGRLLAISLTVSPVYDETGQVIAASGISRDNTEREFARQALAAAHQRTQQVLESVTDGFFALDRAWCITDVNSAAEQMLGMTRENILGLTVCQESVPTITAPLYAALTQAMDERRATVAEGFYPPVDGWLEIRAYPSSEGLSVFFRDVTDRKHLEDVLRDSEARYRSLLDHLPAVVYVLADDEHQTATYFSPRLRELTGYTPEEALADPEKWRWQDLIHPDDRARVEAEDERAYVAGEPFRCEYRLARRDGGFVWVRDECVAVLDETGRDIARQGVLLDITERKAIEEALAAERDLLQTMMDHFPDAVYVKDASSRFLRLNPTTARTLGVAEMSEALGKTDFDFFPESLARQYFADEQQVISSGIPVLNRLEPQSEDDNAAWWLTSTVPMRDATGTVVGLIGSGRDITERLRTEAALQESEARLRALLAALPDLMFRLDRNGTYLDYKADRLDDLVLPPERFLGRTIAETLPSDVADAVSAAISRVVNSGGTETIEYSLDVVGGHADFEARLVASGPDEVVAIVRNVTERARADAELRAAKDAAEKASQLKSAFLSTMSHELRTPLTAIAGYTELLQRGPGLSPEQAADVRQISRSADHLLTLVGDLLDLSRIEVGAMVLRMEPVVVAEIVEETLAQLSPQATAKGLSMENSVPTGLIARGDRQRLRQILLNLVGNAVKFTPQGSIRISGDATGKDIAITVSDTGIGIVPEALPHIFEEFRQADGSMTRQFGGAGLGLAIARKLAELHGGHITVASQSGAGSTFTLHLPAARTRKRAKH
jgi:PAS domain S-box-containing protein